MDPHGMDGAGLIDFLLAHKSPMKPTIVYPLKKMNIMIKLLNKLQGFFSHLSRAEFRPHSQ